MSPLRVEFFPAGARKGKIQVVNQDAELNLHIGKDRIDFHCEVDSEGKERGLIYFNPKQSYAAHNDKTVEGSPISTSIGDKAFLRPQPEVLRIEDHKDNIVTHITVSHVAPAPPDKTR